MSGALLFANEFFYQAFMDRNYEAMEEIWSETAPVTCLHPGWPPVIGRDDVMESWKSIISHPDSPRIRCHMAQPYVYGDAASVICFEEIENRFLVATNVFVRDGSVWKMVHHQSGPTSVEPDMASEQPTGAVN